VRFLPDKPESVGGPDGAVPGATEPDDDAAADG
jgi:hypothetical protein